MKQCRDCHEVKPESLFCLSSQHRDKKYPACKACSKKRRDSAKALRVEREGKKLRGRPPVPPEVRFHGLYSPEPMSGCWLWLGSTDPKGYGKMLGWGKDEKAHRVSYRMYKGEIPAKMHVDHICRNRACVNPDHLRLLTGRENMLCSMHPSAIAFRKNNPDWSV